MFWKEKSFSINVNLLFSCDIVCLFVCFVVQTYTHMEIMRWVLVCIIGILTGLVAFGINVGVKYLFKLKYSNFEASECIRAHATATCSAGLADTVLFLSS